MHSSPFFSLSFHACILCFSSVSSPLLSPTLITHAASPFTLAVLPLSWTTEPSLYEAPNPSLTLRFSPYSHSHIFSILPIFFHSLSCALGYGGFGRTGRNILYRPAIRYTRPPCFVLEKIPAVPANFGQYRPVPGVPAGTEKSLFYFIFLFLSFVIFEFC